MNRANNLYDPSDSKDTEILYRMLMESDNEEGEEIEFEDESNVEYEDLVQEQCSNSDNDQASSSSVKDSFNKNNIDFLIGNDKITKWKTTNAFLALLELPDIPKALPIVGEVQLFR
ncbi:hypothetical protein FQA39_LY10292 [Lamprigera yunnana]|nr:hypothetical protein FQA39_LY10292 [Lamprigera yunnana]